MQSFYDIAADGGQAASGVFDERAYGHVGSHIGRFYGINKFTVTIVYHADNIWFYFFNECNQLSDLFYGEGRSGIVAF